MSHQLTASIDTAQVVLYLFWIFFFGLVVWLRREDRREGYPLESEDFPVRVGLATNVRIPPPKQFMLPHGEGIRRAPNFERDDREIKAERTAKAAGYPLEPVGDPLLSGVGPAAFAKRSNHPELMHEDGGAAIVPMRVARSITVDAGPDPRGWRVLGADGGVAGKITDLWVDRADLMVRYLELELGSDAPRLPAASEAGAEPEAGAEGESRPNARLIPIAMLSLHENTKAVRVKALRSEQFVLVPTTEKRDVITLDEEERVSAFYAGGWFYAEPKRREPLV
jgi:photosynthetic reaction center H subunit